MEWLRRIPSRDDRVIVVLLPSTGLLSAVEITEALPNSLRGRIVEAALTRSQSATARLSPPRE